MTAQQVSRYIELVNRRTHRRILTSSKEVEQDGDRPEYQRNND